MAKQTNERELILETLLSITRDGQYSHIALKNVLDKYQFLEKKERAFITRVVDGTLERMIEIDHIINHFSKVKVNKMKPVIRTILRSSVYQMKYMDSVPNSAVVNEAVKLAGKRGFSTLRGFVNGVLRSIDRGLSEVTYPDLSVKYSLPEWIIHQWEMEGYTKEQIETMAADFLKEKPLTIRTNTARITPEELLKLLEEEGVTVTKIPELPYAYAISGYDYLGALDCFNEGYFYVQDLSSMRVAEWAEPKEGDQIIDVCAAPGGKSIHLAEKLKGTGHVEARDLTEMKVKLIEDNIERSELTNIDACQWDATVLDEDSIGKADIVIADLPCSGLGVLGKKTDLKYKITPEMQMELVNLQSQILSVVHSYVKPGGKLLYSTCTIHKKENEENAAWFEEHFPQFHLVKEKQLLPGFDGGDGFYIALFQKEKDE